MIAALRRLVEVWSEKAQEQEPTALLPGQSDEIERLRDMLLQMTDRSHPKCIVIGVDDEGEQAALAEGILRLVRLKGLVGETIQDRWGMWVRDLPKSTSTAKVHVVLGWHEKQESASVRSCLASGAARMVFIWPIEKVGTVAVPPGAEEFCFDHINQRDGDAACHLVAAVLSHFDDDVEVERAAGFLSDAVLESLATLVCAGEGQRGYDAVQEAGARLANLLRERMALRPNEPLTTPDLRAAIFPPTTVQPPVSLRRLWVEGQTDKQLLELVARRVATANPGVELLQGIVIHPLNGCSQLEHALRNCRPQKKLELFLFDADHDGRRAKAEVEHAGYDALTLSEHCVASAYHRDWVLEDLVGVGALDRFHLESPGLGPAREEISYRGERPGRRLVVEGEAKLKLVEWLDEHANLGDLAGIVLQLQEIRQRFALPPVVSPDPGAPDRRGVRPEPWWFGGS